MLFFFFRHFFFVNSLKKNIFLNFNVSKNNLLFIKNKINYKVLNITQGKTTNSLLNKFNINLFFSISNNYKNIIILTFFFNTYNIYVQPLSYFFNKKRNNFLVFFFNLKSTALLKIYFFFIKKNKKYILFVDKFVKSIIFSVCVLIKCVFFFIYLKNMIFFINFINYFIHIKLLIYYKSYTNLLNYWPNLI